ncbi:DEAD-box ATP-dependent RNA helicase [Rhizoctonia solani AG-3 Rhs1AP]|uniref:ATP-dependent RNA helicase n=1 Tax=Rhizoctonia solani AG-3 Rhs1AP TaxID=1086054 RepID=X8IZ15_9AGAM|nr:DEAD-box ATP-dependent RNA helicase [Rhizoctonia solani AG-3 Rhs1AP]
MSFRVLTQVRLALRPTILPTLRVAIAQRAASVPLPIQYSVTRAFSISRPWLAAEAVKLQPHSSQDGSISTPVEENKADIGVMPFSSIKDLISPETYEAITYKPYQLKNMTPVQTAVLSLIPQLTQHHTELKPGPDGKLPPRDLMVRAKTGTGKTLAFLVPAIEARVAAIERAKKQALETAGLTRDRMYEARAARAFTRTDAGTLIISPTRELATQIANEALKLTHHHEGFEVRLFVGGNSKREQMRGWMRGRRDIVVATPGRLRDLLQSEPSIAEGLKNTQMLILDEADTLLDMGFRDDLEDIISYLPKSPERQTMLYSATVSRAIQQVARAALDKNHEFINTVQEEDSPVHAHIPQYHTVLPRAEDQLPHILRLLAHDQLTNPGKSKTIVFLPTTKMTQMHASLLRDLARDTLPAGRSTQIYEIHSRKDQDSRSKTSDRFRKDTSGASVLVTSDVSARGVDYPGVTRVIQVGIPSSSDQYIHRIGRTGRAGTEGRGDLVLLPWEIGFVTWQLTHVPMKPTTVKQIEAEVLALAAKHDEDPAKFYTPPPAPRAGRSRFNDTSQASMPATFSSRLLEKANQIQTIVKETLAGLDSLSVEETFVSLLGYYIAKAPEIRVQKGIVLQGCKDWATGAAGLLEEPYVSEAFLAKLGYSDGRTKRFGTRRTEYTGKGRPGSLKAAPWEGRGSQRNRDQDDRAGRFGDRDRDQAFGDRKRTFGDRDQAFGDRKRTFGDRDQAFGDRKRAFGDRDRGFADKDRGRGFGAREDRGRFGDREDRGGFRDREDRSRLDDRGGDRQRRSILEDPDSASEFVGTRYGKRPRNEPRL